MFKYFLFVTDVLVCQAQPAELFPANKLDLGAVERFHPTRSRGSVVVVVVVVVVFRNNVRPDDIGDRLFLNSVGAANSSPVTLVCEYFSCHTGN